MPTKVVEVRDEQGRVLNRIDALEQQLNELAARDSKAKEEPQETPPPDPVLATVEAEFAAMRQIIEEK